MKPIEAAEGLKQDRVKTKPFKCGKVLNQLAEAIA